MSLLEDAQKAISTSVNWNDVHDRLDTDMALALHCRAILMPKMVAALEAAKEIVDMYPAEEPYYEESAGYIFCAGGLGLGHSSGCQWQALVTALKGEHVSA